LSGCGNERRKTGQLSAIRFRFVSKSVIRHPLSPLTTVNDEREWRTGSEASRGLSYFLRLRSKGIADGPRARCSIPRRGRPRLLQASAPRRRNRQSAPPHGPLAPPPRKPVSPMPRRPFPSSSVPFASQGWSCLERLPRALQGSDTPYSWPPCWRSSSTTSLWP
jgi:hypothetical protein